MTVRHQDPLQSPSHQPTPLDQDPSGRDADTLSPSAAEEDVDPRMYEVQPGDIEREADQ